MSKVKSQKSKVQSPKSAFSLIETLVAVAIFSIAIVAVIEGMATSSRNQALIENESKALMLAQNIMEEIEYVGDHHVGSDGGEFDGENAGFEWTCETTDTDYPGLFEVRVTVSWKEIETQRDVQLVTYLRTTENETTSTLQMEY